MNILVINGHKYYSYSEGKLNMTMFEEIVRLVKPEHNVKTTIVEKGYDVREETDKFLWADLIIFQTPVNWYSAPWLLKKYIDEVYQYGIFYTGSEKYGSGGLLKGKKYMYSLTWGTPLEAFNDPQGFLEGKNVDDIYIAMHKLQEFCALEQLPTFSVYGVIKNPDIDKFKNDLAKHIKEHVVTFTL